VLQVTLLFLFLHVIGIGGQTVELEWMVSATPDEDCFVFLFKPALPVFVPRDCGHKLKECNAAFASAGS